MQMRSLFSRKIVQAQELFYRWALRGRAPEPVPVVLSQHRIYVLPTRLGLAYALTLLAMLIGAINYNLSLGYALVFLLAGLGANAILHTFKNLLHLEVSLGRCLPVFAGDIAVFQLLLVNRRVNARPAVCFLPAGRAVEEVLTVDIAANGQTQLSVGLPAAQRGWLILPRLTVSTVYPLGLIRAWAYVAPEMRCLVYPEPIKNTWAIPHHAGGQGGSSSVSAGQDDFVGLRNHQASDSLRHVAWKNVARQANENLLTKQFNASAAQTLWFDWQGLPAQMDVEMRLSILARWVCDAHRDNLLWGLRLPGVCIAPDQGAQHYHACLRQLALYAPD